MSAIAEAIRRVYNFTFADPRLVEYRRQQAIVDARAEHVLRETAMPREDAFRVALFSLGRWAERYPAQPHDLGERAPIFLATWCRARAVSPSDDVLHEALREWQAQELAEDLKIVTAKWWRGMSAITWTPKMCERCKIRPALICHGDDWDVPGGREQANAILCGDCETSVGAPPETFHCNGWRLVEALVDMRSAPTTPPPPSATLTR